MPQPYDEDAFRAFVMARTPALSRTAYLLTGDAHLAEDLVQTALFKAAKSWHRIQGDPEPYVRRILYTQNISWWRSRRHVREHQLGAYDAPAPHRGRRPAAQPRAGARPADHPAADRAGAALLRGPHRGADRGDARHRAGTVKSTSRQALARLRTLAPDWPSTWETGHDPPLTSCSGSPTGHRSPTYPTTPGPAPARAQRRDLALTVAGSWPRSPCSPARSPGCPTSRAAGRRHGLPRRPRPPVRRARADVGHRRRTAHGRETRSRTTRQSSAWAPRRG